MSKRAIIVLVIGLAMWQACSSEIDRTRESNVVILPLVDKTGPQLVSATPYDGLSSVLTSTPVTLIFNEGVDPETIDFTSDTNCSGSVQLSKDDFSSCVTFQAPALANSNQLVSLQPIDPLEAVTTYKLRLTDKITDNRSNALKSTYEMSQGFTTVDSVSATLPNQLASELSLALQQAVGLTQRNRLSHSAANVPEISETQIDVIVTAALDQVKNSRNYYATDLSDILGAMVYGALEGLGQVNLGNDSDRPLIVQMILESLVNSMNGKAYYIRNSEKLLENLTNTAVRRLPEAGFSETTLADGVSAVLSGMLGGLETSGLGEGDMMKVMPTVLGTLVGASSDVVEEVTVARKNAKETDVSDVAIVSTSSMSVLQQIMFNTSSTVVNSMTSWYWWSAASTQWSSYYSVAMSSVLSSTTMINGLQASQAQTLVTNSVTGFMQSFGQVSISQSTTLTSVSTSLGYTIAQSISTLAYLDGSMNFVQTAVSIQSTTSLTLQNYTQVSTVVSSLNIGMVSGAAASGQDATQLEAVLDDNVDGPDTEAPTLTVTTPIGITNNTMPTLVVFSNESGSYSENCSESTGSLSSGENTLTLSRLGEGSYSNCVLTVEDIVGNIRTLNIPSFTIDTTAPSVSGFSINNGAITASSRSLSLSWTATDGLAGLSAYYIGETASVPAAVSDNWQNYTSETNYSLNSTTLGSRSLYVWVKDAAGNVSSSVVSSITLIDTAGPSIASFTVLGGATYTNQQTNPLSISASDDLSGIAAYFADEDSTTPLVNASGWLAYSLPTYTFDNTTNGSKQVYLWLQDAEGNRSSLSTDNITLDTVHPVLDNFSIADNATTVNTQTVNLTVGATDSLSGVGFVYSSEDNTTTPSPSASGWKVYGSATHTFDNVSLGNKIVYVWVKDNVGNVADYLEDDVTLIDNISPAINSFVLASGSAYVNDDNMSMILSGSDDLSGVTHYLISENSSTPSSGDVGWQPYTTSSYYQFDNTTNEQKTVYVWLKDVAGNISASSSQQLTFDNVDPVISSFTLAGGVDNTSDSTVFFTQTSSDALSGIVSYLLKENATTPTVDDPDWLDYSSIAPSYTFDNVSLENKTVYLWLKDNASNITSASDGIELIDGTPPEITSFEVAGGATYTNTDTVSMTLSGTDSQSGVTHYLVNESSSIPSASDIDWTTYTTNGTYQFASTSNGNKTIYLWLMDAYQNISASQSEVIIFDNLSPTITTFSLASGADNTTSTTINIAISASDNTSGISYYLLSEVQSTAPASDSTDWVGYTSFPTNYTFDNASIGTKTVYFWIKDGAENIAGSSGSIEFIDGIAPNGTSISINGGAASTVNQSVTLSLTASDAGGVAAYYVSEESATPTVNANDWVSIIPNETNYNVSDLSFTLSSGEGTKQIYAWFKDAGGNISSVVYDTITY